MASDLKSDLVMMTLQRRLHVKLMGNPAVCTAKLCTQKLDQVQT